MDNKKNEGRRLSALLTSLLIGIHATWIPLTWAQPSFQDPLDTPATMQQKPSQQPLMSITTQGNRILAFGMRGLIIVSDDQGHSWRQTAVPVQSDLLAAHFTTPSHGWVVGHNGVVLHTTDGGLSWVKQLDGLKASDTLPRYYAARIKAGETHLEPYAQQIAINFRPDAALPLLDIWFDDAQQGYAVGAFGTLLQTFDGGQSWQPALHKIDNPDMLHLNAIARVDGHLFIAAERGRVFRFEESTSSFVPMDTGYAGGLFGVEGGEHTLLVYGLGGKAFTSQDKGESWRELDNASSASLTGSAFDPVEKRFLLVNSKGELLALGLTDNRLDILQATPDLLTDVSVPSQGELITVGLAGVNRHACMAQSCR